MTIPPAAAVKVRLSLMFPDTMLVAFAATATWARITEFAGADGATGDAAGVPVMISTAPNDDDVPTSDT